jgi:outer membrane protein OmpA-like peptidoglycan-associated protein
MLPSGQQKVQKLVQDINSMSAKVEQIRIVGHTDRLGSDGYNDKLSLGRAKAVATYMQQQGLTIPMTTAGHGEREPVTTNCKGTKATSQLINCLQPDRRVSIDLIGVVEQVEETGVSSK